MHDIRLRRADRLRRFVAARLRGLRLGGHFAAATVERDQCLGHGRGAAPRHGGIEGGGIVTDQADVVHGAAL